MLRHSLLALSSVCLLALASCEGEGEYESEDGTVSGDITLDEDSGETAGEGDHLGTGTVTLENGGTFRGDFYDTDEDGRPDKFKPKRGQGSKNVEGETNGKDWYDIEFK